ncbi:hypothetical protein ABPG73_001908 [Tetrahymena malaccensis]
MNHSVFSIIILLSILNSLQAQSIIDYCEQYLHNNQGCQKCQDGFNLQQQAIQAQSILLSQPINYCISQCPYLSYRQTQFSDIENQCQPTCLYNEIGDNYTRACKQIDECPQSFEFGQQFHSGYVSSILLFPFTNQQPVTDVITASQDDTQILVWDNQSGALKAKLIGHNSNVIQIYFLSEQINNQILLLSFSFGGEILIWDYIKGQINTQFLIYSGQLTQNSAVNIQTSLIISYGFQGDFYVINYVNQDIQSYIGHDSIVKQVIFVDNDNFVSFANDEKVILWNINQPNNPLVLVNQNVAKINSFVIFNEKIQIYQQYLILMSQTNLTSQISISVCNLQDQNGNIIQDVSNLQVVNKIDNQFDFIDFIIDSQDNMIIAYSSHEILIYKITTNESGFQVDLSEKVNNIESNYSVLIQSCVLFQTNLMILTNLKQLLLFQLVINNQPGQSHLQSQANNIINIERQQNFNYQIVFAFSVQDQILYVGQDYLLSINYNNKKTNYLINNWLAPVINHKDININLDYSQVSQIICDISQDGRSFVYDFLSKQLLSVLVHPQNTQTQINVPIQITLVRNLNACISYNNTSIVCFDPISTNVNFIYTNGIENYVSLSQDPKNNYLIASSISLLQIFDLNSNTIYSQYQKQNQFFIINFNFNGKLLYASTPSGYYMKFNYPDLTIDKEYDYTTIAINQKIIGWSLDLQYFQASATYFDGGLILIIKQDLSLIKQIQNDTPATLCGVKYPSILACINQKGKTQVWSIFTDFYISVIGLEFPVSYGAATMYGLSLLQMNQQAFGSGILVVDMTQLTFSQTFSTSKQIQSIKNEDSMMRVFACMQSGEIQDYHYTYQPTQLINWQNQNANNTINKLIIFEEDYKLIILSSGITIYDYLNLNIYKIQQFHNQQITGAVIDKLRYTIVTFNQDISKNVFMWQYKNDSYQELVGHTQGVNGAILINNTTNLITYSNDGFIILWDYIKAVILNKFNLHSSQAVLNLFYSQITKGSSLINIVISQGKNQMVQIFDIKNQQTISQIQLKNTNCSITIDVSTNTLFTYNSNAIYAYSYITGLQISTLLGFDGAISNFIFQGNYIIATATFVIQSYDRSSLKLLNSNKYSQQIYQIDILNDLVGMVSNLINDIIQLWNYKTGIMQKDMDNQYYPLPVNGIIADQDAQIFLVWNNQNQIFSFNPFSYSLNKVQNYVILPLFNQNLIKSIVIDFQSNIFFAFNDQQIIIQKYYSFLGISGQETDIPQNSVNNLSSYNIEQDKLIYTDLEQNIWMVNQNSLKFAGKLPLVPYTSQSLLDIQSFNMTIFNVSAALVQCNGCNGAVVQAQASNILLFDSSFSNSTGFQGGAIYLKQCTQSCFINSSYFYGNSAINGGAIYLEFSQIQINSTQINNNQAVIGGGIRYVGIVPDQFQQIQTQQRVLQKNNNSIQNNKAQVFGNNIGSYPRNLNIIFKQQDYTVQNLSQNQVSENSGLVYDVNDFMSGANLQFQVQLIDEEGEYIKIEQNNFPKLIQQELGSYQISVQGQNNQIQLVSESLIGLNKYDINTHSFVFDKLIINSRPLTSNVIYVFANSILIPSNGNQTQLITPQFQVKININFRKCEIGEILIKNQAGSLEYCYPCPLGMYSLVDTMLSKNQLSCNSCPANAVKCEQNKITLMNGYWRESNTTDQIIECSNQPLNCKGEDPNSLNYCSEGYIGPLCESCDLFGTYWNIKYSRVAKYQCKKCEEMKSEYVIQLLAYFTIILYIFYGVLSAYKISIKRAVGYYIRLMGAASIGVSDSDDFTSVYLKFIMHYLYISSIIKIQQFQFPELIDFFRIQISSPIDSMRFVPDCYQSQFSMGLKPVFIRQVISQVLPVLYLSGMGLIYLILIITKVTKFKKSIIISGLVFIFIFLQPNVNSSLISVSSCRSIGSQNYITDDISEKCLTQEHIVFLLSFCLPFFIIWSILIPTILLYKIYKQRKFLNSVFNRVKYGFLYQEYRFNSWYWEFTKIGVKLLITFFDNFLNDHLILKSVSASIIIIIYLLFLIKQQPYVSLQFNKFDKASHTVLFVIMQLSILIQASTLTIIVDLGVISFYIIHFTYLCVLLLYVLKSQIEYIFLRLFKLFPSLQENLSFLKRYLKLFKNNSLVFKRWKLIWNHLFVTKKIFQLNGEKINTIQNRKSIFQKQLIHPNSQRSIFNSNNNILSEIKITYDSTRHLFQNKLSILKKETCDSIKDQKKNQVNRESIILDVENCELKDSLNFPSSNNNVRSKSNSTGQTLYQYNFNEIIKTQQFFTKNTKQIIESNIQ